MGRPDITLSAAAGPQTISDDDSAIFSLSLFFILVPLIVAEAQRLCNTSVKTICYCAVGPRWHCFLPISDSNCLSIAPVTTCPHHKFPFRENVERLRKCERFLSFPHVTCLQEIESSPGPRSSVCRPIEKRALRRYFYPLQTQTQPMAVRCS